MLPTEAQEVTFIQSKEDTIIVDQCGHLQHVIKACDYVAVL